LCIDNWHFILFDFPLFLFAIWIAHQTSFAPCDMIASYTRNHLTHQCVASWSVYKSFVWSSRTHNKYEEITSVLTAYHKYHTYHMITYVFIILQWDLSIDNSLIQIATLKGWIVWSSILNCRVICILPQSTNDQCVN